VIVFKFLLQNAKIIFLRHQTVTSAAHKLAQMNMLANRKLGYQKPYGIF
jgi:hypothetical protein